MQNGKCPENNYGVVPTCVLPTLEIGHFRWPYRPKLLWTECDQTVGPESLLNWQRVATDGWHLRVGGCRRVGNLPPPMRGMAYHSSVAVMYILRYVLVDGDHEIPNADVAWPEPLRPRPHAPTPGKLTGCNVQSMALVRGQQMLYSSCNRGNTTLQDTTICGVIVLLSVCASERLSGFIDLVNNQTDTTGTLKGSHQL